MGTAQVRYQRTLRLTTPRNRGRWYNPGVGSDDFTPTPIDEIATKAASNPINPKPKISTVGDVYNTLAELGNVYDKVSKHLDDGQSRKAYAFFLKSERLKARVEGLVKVVEAGYEIMLGFTDEMESLYSQRENLLARMNVRAYK